MESSISRILEDPTSKELCVFPPQFFFVLRARRENIEMVKRIGKFSLLLKRLKDAWMDMPPTSSMRETRRPNQYHADVAKEMKKDKEEVRNF